MNLARRAITFSEVISSLRGKVLFALAVLVSLAVFAAACGESDDMADEDNAGNTTDDDNRATTNNAPDDTTPVPTRFDTDEDAGIFAPQQIPGDEPNRGPSALRGPRNNPRFPDPLVELRLIISGGPPPDGIPAIERPTFEEVAAVDWLQPQEAVIAVEIGGEARAYPVQILIAHEIVNDTFGNRPVTITYCPLCNSAVAFDRRLDGQTFTFGTSGSLYNSALVMYDRQTESLWTHYDGQAVAGQLTGARLNLIPVATVAWETFTTEYPDGLVLSRNTGLRSSYGSNPYVGYDNPDTSPFLLAGAPDPRLPAKTRVLAIRSGGQAVAVVTESLAAVGVKMVDVGPDDLSVVAFHQAGTATPLEHREIALGRDVGATAVYLTEVDGQSLTFARTADDRFIDNETGSTWTLLGSAIDGPLAGSRLTPVEHLDTFWFSIAAYSPNVEIIQ